MEVGGVGVVGRLEGGCAQGNERMVWDSVAVDGCESAMRSLRR